MEITRREFLENMVKGAVFLGIAGCVSRYTSPPIYDLADYPSMFADESNFDGRIVVGEKAPASDVVSATDIVAGLTYEGLTVPLVLLDSEVSS